MSQFAKWFTAGLFAVSLSCVLLGCGGGPAKSPDDAKTPGKTAEEQGAGGSGSTNAEQGSDTK